MEIEKEKAVAFVGYCEAELLGRSENKTYLESMISDSKNQKLQSIIRDTSTAISELYTKGCRYFLCRMYDGFDLIAAQIVIDLKEKYAEMRLIAVVPFKDQEAKYSIQDKATYEWILERADEVVILADSFIENAQYLHRNDYMLERASHLICYFDGQKGGTMYTYNRTVKRGVEIVNVCNNRMLD